ncbi:hypothetical protein [Diaphorobacter sp. HDW4A]|uniref:hypothetical protein n=1 Tax=Diaphorobacter sp. HDW4A TaxID=2714924 RepID=UPI001F0EB16C|nr:hypothetical protein [Diaphorobacter sp. HDW4A]
MEETGSIFVREGVARRTEFTLNLKRADDAQADPAGGSDGARFGMTGGRVKIWIGGSNDR